MYQNMYQMVVYTFLIILEEKNIYLLNLKISLNCKIFYNFTYKNICPLILRARSNNHLFFKISQFQ